MKMQRKGILTKLLAIGGICILLLIGLTVIKDGILVDRELASEYAVETIHEGAGGIVAINGFYIDVPYVDTDSVQKTNSKGEVYYETLRTTGIETLEPVSLTVVSDIDAEERPLGIYSAPIYTGIVKMQAEFDMNLQNHGIREYDFDRAQMYVCISSRNLSRTPYFIVNSHKYRADYGTTSKGSGVIKTGISDKPGTITVSTELNVTGAVAFSVTPVKGATSLDIACNWPSPGFTGFYQLPHTRELSESGFSASWFVPFTRGNNRSYFEDAIGFTFTDPVDLYSMVYRAFNYGILFIVIPFVAFFLFEIFAKVQLHPMHYLLSGAACIMFFLLLLAFSEHMAFGFSYLLSAGAVSALVCLYTGSVSGRKKMGWGMLPVMGALYGFMLVSLQSEDYALLWGSLFLFGVIAVTMFTTRKVDWSSLGEKESIPAPDSTGPQQ